MSTVGQMISTFVGISNQSYGGNVPTVSTRLSGPYGVHGDSFGNIYIADSWNNTVHKVDTNGIFSTVAGIGIPGYSGDGGPGTSAELANPSGVFADENGNVFICVSGNNRIRKVDAYGTISTAMGVLNI